MNRVMGVYQRGRVTLDTPVDWPEGHRVVVEPEHSGAMEMENEEEHTQEPHALDEWLARFDALEPLEFTPQDEARIAKAREEVRRVTVEAVKRKMEGSR
jgi:hypothetical protein